MGFCRIRKSRGKRPQHLEALLAEKIIYFVSSPAREFERAQIDLDASEAPSQLHDLWESRLRLLIEDRGFANCMQATCVGVCPIIASKRRGRVWTITSRLDPFHQAALFLYYRAANGDEQA